LAGIGLALKNGSATRSILAARKGVVALAFQNAVLTAARWENPVPRATAEPSAPVTVKVIQGRVPFSPAEALLVEQTLEGAAFPSGPMTLGGIGNAQAISGTGTAQIAKLGPTEVDATFELPAPRLFDVEMLAEPFGATVLALRVTGERMAPTISGSLQPTQGRIANTLLTNVRNALAKFGPAKLETEYRIPIEIDSQSASGSWSFTEPSGGIVYLEGALEKIRLHGGLWVGAGDRVPRLEVSSGGFSLEAKGAVRVLHPFLFGGEPGDTTVGTGFAVSTATGFEYGRNTKAGALDISASFFEVSKPSLAFETDEEPRFRIQAPARLEAGTTVRFALADGAVSLASGRLRIGAASADAVGGAPLLLSGIEVVGSSLAFDSLAIAAADARAEVEIHGLAIAAREVEHDGTPRWSAKDLTPSFGHISATLDHIDGSMKLRQIAIHDLSLTAARGAFVSPDGLQVRGDDFSISANKLTNTSIEDGEIRIASGSVALDVVRDRQRTTGSSQFSEFRVAADGIKDNLRGTGRLRLSNLEVEHRFGLIPDKCEDDLPLIAEVDLRQVDLALSWVAGKLSGSATVKRPRVGVREGRVGSSCTWRQDFEVSIAKTVQAWQCLSFDIFGCLVAGWVDKVVDTDVEVRVPFTARLLRLRAGAEADRADVRLVRDKIGFCLTDVRLTPETAFSQVFSVAPDLGAYGGDIGRAASAPAQVVVDAAFGAALSLFTNSILQPLTLLTQATNIKVCDG
jgi:hypothetical protein